jgi:type IV secretory pathway component VirB8
MQHSTPHPVDTDNVRQMLESGDYFATARNWYDELYHRPLAERSFFVVITLMAAVTIVVALVVYASLFPLTRAVPYTILTEEEYSDDMPYIAALREEPSEDLNVAVSRFLLRNYVVTREKYLYDVVDLERRFNRIRATSAEVEFGKYQAETNPENPSSPYNKYGRDIRREVQLGKVQIDLNAVPAQARVYFTSYLNKAGGQQQANQWLATIAFRFPPLTVDQQTNKVLQWDENNKKFVPMEYVAFEVMDYSTQEIGSVP